MLNTLNQQNVLLVPKTGTAHQKCACSNRQYDESMDEPTILNVTFFFFSRHCYALQLHHLAKTDMATDSYRAVPATLGKQTLVLSR